MRVALTMLVMTLGIGTFVSAETGRAVVLSTGDGSSKGTVTFTDTKNGLHVLAELRGVPPGDHGFHIHEFGSCENLGAAAGGHYNPMSSPHGHASKDGIKKAHAGDLGNITIDAQGNGRLEAVLPNVTLSGDRHTVGGRAVILHEKADDFGQPLGNAGGRIGCGTILITAK